MSRRYILIGLLILLLIGSQSVFASAPKLGTSAAPELFIPMGARNVALGGANIANVGGAEGIYWNPAGLAKMNVASATFNYMQYFADMKVSYLAAGARVGRSGAVGIAFQVMDIGEIEVTTIDMPEGTGEMLSPDYLTVTATYSNRFTDRISFGTNAKMISEKVGNMSASAVAFDFGLQYVSPFGIAFGVTMRNIGSKLQWDGTGIEFDSSVPWAGPTATSRKTKLDLAEEELPASMNMGLGYTMNFGTMHKLSLAGAYSNNTFMLDAISTGAEYSLNDMLFLRGGYMMTLYPEDYESGYEKAQYGLTFGFGLNLNMGGNKIMFDYANRPMDIFDANQYFSVSFAF